MKHTRKLPLWRHSAKEDVRRAMREDGLPQEAADQEGRALLESYCRLYRAKRSGRNFL